MYDIEDYNTRTVVSYVCVQHEISAKHDVA